MHLAPNDRSGFAVGYKLIMSDRFCGDTGCYQAVEQLLFPKPSVETITNLGKVCL